MSMSFADGEDLGGAVSAPRRWDGLQAPAAKRPLQPAAAMFPMKPGAAMATAPTSAGYPGDGDGFK
ncbi:hypothetical protein [Paucibacter sp. M5-1]|uniref:hypothetical protein n=1 Tax=Paucibacter sp. M5-1 TaxID=3015998 RepID=UPI0022B8D443|nr:hypothetical protein [Paucibacter sp. M5-1]MCZ7880085.1 hypothetical protein [Paucibacter sp. M5-1]